MNKILIHLNLSLQTFVVLLLRLVCKLSLLECDYGIKFLRIVYNLIVEVEGNYKSLVDQPLRSLLLNLMLLGNLKLKSALYLGFIVSQASSCN